jgi:hypothetical protein
VPDHTVNDVLSCVYRYDVGLEQMMMMMMMMMCVLCCVVFCRYDVGLEVAAREWVEAVLGEPALGDGPLGPALKDGQALCRLINTIKPGTVRRIETSKLVSWVERI